MYLSFFFPKKLIFVF
uniref:Uncharacterized protein n=1 Tax=Lepeophtheirus salmonis TaxID=72036 RepID=A0A0K2V4G2_LEPSM